MEVVGVDGTRGGWVAVALDSDGQFASDHILSDVATDFAEFDAARIIAIDVPIGFGPRRADAAARAYLSGTPSVVFTMPWRDLLEGPFGPGLGISAQSHALGPRVIHVTHLARSDAPFREVHPEVSFRAMNGGRPLGHRKKSAAGALIRIELLRREGIDLTRLTQASSAPLDDVLDAAAAAWSALRILAGEAKSLPEPPELVDGYPVAIWY
jgi:predicted RNase H-like nuclease